MKILNFALLTLLAFVAGCGSEPTNGLFGECIGDPIRGEKGRRSRGRQDWQYQILRPVKPFEGFDPSASSDDGSSSSDYYVVVDKQGNCKELCFMNGKCPARTKYIEKLYQQLCSTFGKPKKTWTKEKAKTAFHDRRVSKIDLFQKDGYSVILTTVIYPDTRIIDWLRLEMGVAGTMAEDDL